MIWRAGGAGFRRDSRRQFQFNRRFRVQSTAIGPCPDAGLPPKDAPVLAAAIASRADRLLTGDLKHFGHLYGKTIEGVLVVSPRSLSEEIVKLGWR